MTDTLRLLLEKPSRKWTDNDIALVGEWLVSQDFEVDRVVGLITDAQVAGLSASNPRLRALEKKLAVDKIKEAVKGALRSEEW